MRLIIGFTMLLGLSGAATAGDRIVPVRQNGRFIFVNDESSASPAVAQRAGGCENAPLKRYVYWSNTEKRWKRVNAPTRTAVREACSAAQEVNAALSVARPAIQGPSTQASAASAAWTTAAVDALIEETARKHSVDPNLVRAMIKVESNFNPRAVSSKGAVGLMQLMPSTARELRVRNPYDPAQNLDGGIRHMKSLLEKNNGDVVLSLAAYNAGQGAVDRHGGVPRYRETRDYVRRIAELYADNGPIGGTITKRALIKESRDSDGHRVYTND